MESTHGGPQLSAGRATDDWPDPEVSRYAPQFESESGYRYTGEDAPTYGLGDSSVVPQQRFGPSRIPPGSLSWYTPEAGLLNYRALPADSLSNGIQYLDTRKSDKMDNYGGIPENFEFEDIEQFIRRIEDEAEVPRGQMGDNWASPYAELGVLDIPASQPLAVSEIAKFDRADDTAVMPERNWFDLETTLPEPTGNPGTLPQDASFTCPRTLSMLERYALVEREGYSRDVW